MINSAVTGGHKTFVMMEKQTNNNDKIKCWKYAQCLIADVNCFRVGGEGGRGGGAVHVREGKEELENILLLTLACA